MRGNPLSISRRRFFVGVAAAAASLSSSSARSFAEESQSQGDNLQSSQANSNESISPVPTLAREHWRVLDDHLRGLWDKNVTRADESAVRDDPSKTLMFLPAPYVRIGEQNTVYPEMFPDDANYFNMALLLHDRLDLMKGHFQNYIFSVNRFGYVPNANSSTLLTRSSVHFLPLTLLKYFYRTHDWPLLEEAFIAVKLEYRSYWLAEHHATPTGLSTYRDLGDPVLSPELAAEAESAMDFTPIWGGDVRQCVPLNLNCILVIYARCLAKMAYLLGHREDARNFEADAEKRTRLITQFCWSPEHKTFLEYNYLTKRHIQIYSDGCFWALWAGVASSEQAQGVVANLHRLEKPFGLSVTDKAYPDPHDPAVYEMRNGVGRIQDQIARDSPAAYHGGRNPLMWMYPAGWGSLQIIGCSGLDAYGFKLEAKRISQRFLAAVVSQFQLTGKLWEKYNLNDGNLVLPNARYGNIPYYSFTGGAAVALGHFLFNSRSLTEVACLEES
jgi:alpha,alpha-trehalase